MNTSQDSPSLGFTQRITLLIACLVFSAFLLFFKGAIDQENSLDYLARSSLEPTVALGNGKPTVFEFYADWCEVCKSMAPAISSLDKDYKGKIDIVMLNVDNAQWEEYIDQFDVNGIPKLAFFDQYGKLKTTSIGGKSKEELEYLFKNLMEERSFKDYDQSSLETQVSSLSGKKPYFEQAIEPRSH